MRVPPKSNWAAYVKASSLHWPAPSLQRNVSSRVFSPTAFLKELVLFVATFVEAAWNQYDYEHMQMTRLLPSCDASNQL